MKTKLGPKLIKHPYRVFLVFSFLLCANALYAQQVPDSTQTGVSLGRIELEDPESITSKYSYDPITGNYIYTQKLGEYDIRYPVILTPEQYEELILKQQMRDYFKGKIDAISGREGSEESQKNLLPNFYVNSDFFQSVFGGNTIEVIPQGSVAMDLGVRFQKNDNPALSPRNRSNISFDFDQRISLSLMGKVGTRLSINANYDTEATFDFQNLIKLEYTPDEDNIIQKIEVGNVSMPLNSSLISGAQSLFGIKTELQFGRTTVTGVYSEQRSQSRSVVAQGGGTINEFEIMALDYDEDRHFFLSHFFRDQYDTALENYPYIRSQVQITRIEVWVTNRTQRTQNVRNLVALQDLGEPDPENTRINEDAPGGFFNMGNNLPSNQANDYNPLGIQNGTSVLNPAIRDIATVRQGFNISGYAVNQGYDYSILENARKLEPNREYTLNTQLGYISLNQRLSNDEVLAVAYQYTYQGQVYQVGEFANDGVNATEFEENNGVITQVNPQALVVKMLKSNVTVVDDPVWDLMMKNFYATTAFQLSEEDFKLNILYTDPSPINYISPVDQATWPDGLEEKILLNVFNFDRLNTYNDPQNGGDGYFDFLPGITVDAQNGIIKFTKVEPFGEYLYEVLGGGGNYDSDAYNPNENQEKYVYRNMYKVTKSASLENAEKNKFMLKGRYKAESSGGIPLGAFNVPRGSVRVTAGGRMLQEGIDYTVNYQAGTVQILDPGLRASNTPIEVSVENNAVFGQQTRRFSGIHVEHQFSDKLSIGGTFLNMNERPLTQKSNFGVEPVNNTILGLNGTYSTEIPFLTRMVNKLPNIDTDVASNLSVRGEFAYLMPGAPKSADFNGEVTSYLDDFEGAQSFIDIRSALAWSLASTPLDYGGELENDNPASRHSRAKMSWYTIDPIFYSSQRPGGVSSDDISTNDTRRIFIDEIFPQQDVAQGQTLVQPTLDISYYPQEKGPYNDNQNFENLTSQDKWGGIMRSINSTNFEQSNVEYIQFWMLDPYYQDGVLSGEEGELVFNLGSINEDILKDGRKQYENGLPLEQNPALVNTTNFGKVPSTQSLVYAFNANSGDRVLQDVGYDGLSNSEESNFYNNPGPDPALDDYQFYLNATGSIPERYKNYNNPEGNSPVQVGDNNRGSTTLPDVEDIDRDLTMNTVDNYLEYRIPIGPNLQRNDKFVTDIREVEVEAPNRDSYRVRWIQFKVPIDQHEVPDNADDVDEQAILRSMSFMRLFLTGFDQQVTLRFATLDLVRGDWRMYTNSLQPEDDPDPSDDNTLVDVNTVNILENEQRTPIPYKLPPGVVREQLNNNNTIIRQNEQSLSFGVENLNPMDSRGVFKNVDIDLRQYKRLKMFIHAERYQDMPAPADGDLVAFLRLGTDFTQNYYQVEIPLQITPGGSTDPAVIWPEVNGMDLPLSLLSKIKAQGIADGTLQEASFYDQDGNPIDEFERLDIGQMKVAIKGNPSLGNIRALMVGVKNPSTGVGDGVSGEVWFNELRLAELDNEGGWAAVAAMDLNIADFANISTTANMSTSGFGSIDQMPGERSLEDVRGYALNSNVNLGQLLPKGWGIQLPMNYSVSEELITPEFDPLYQDLRLDDRLDAAQTTAEKDAIKNQAEDYTKRKSINFIGVRKNRGEEQKPRVYDIENFTFNFAYNQMEHRDYEIENLEDQNVRAGVVYSHSFKPLEVAPLQNADSLLNDKYWSWLKDFNFNLLPTSISLNSNINRNLNRQSFRQVLEQGGDSDFLGLPEVQQRNYMFDWQYAINYNLTKSLQFNFTASNNSIVKNYFTQGEDGEQLVNRDLAIWDGFWDVGDPNHHAQQLQVNYDLPFSKFPFLDFMSATYAYTGSFDWQRGSDVLTEIAGEQLNTIQNANTHNFNGALTMDKLYSSLGLERKGRGSGSRGSLPIADPNGTAAATETKQKKYGMYNTFIDLATMVKRINVSYSENRGKVLPGYTPSIGFIGTLKPSWGFVFGSQSDVRYEAAQKGWLTTFPEFNDQYMSRKANQLNISANIEPFQGLTIDLIADRQYSESYAENFSIEDINSDGILDYNALIQNKFGDFSISSMMIRTAFDQSEEAQSETFNKFSENRIVVAQRLAGVPINPNATEYPEGYGPTNQAVLLPAFVAAYTGQDASSVSTDIFRDTPVPNWSLKYTGLMQIGWFKDNFRRFSLAHGYRSSYSVNSFRSNLDYGQGDQFDQSGNFKNPILITNATLVEQFNPLIRVDFEMANSLSVLAEMRKDRALSLSFDNNLLTEMSGNEYVIGLGYRIPNIKFVTHIGGRRSVMSGDLNLKADLSLRDNITVIRNLDINTNQVTAGQNIWSLKFTADYALSQNLTALFFYDHSFSEFKVSTAFPQTTIRTGFTLRYNFGN